MAILYRWKIVDFKAPLTGKSPNLKDLTMWNPFGRARSAQRNRNEPPKVHTMMRVDRRRTVRPGSDVQAENTLRCIDATGTDQIGIDGEVYHQEMLRQFAASAHGPVTAALIPEQNKFDPDAVTVYIEGHKCGYIPSSQAGGALRDAIRRCTESASTSFSGVGCAATIGVDRSGKFRLTLAIDTELLADPSWLDLASETESAAARSESVVPQLSVPEAGHVQPIAPRVIHAPRPLIS